MSAVVMVHAAAKALGITDSEKPYVYLTDGGHFENLGLYELAQRRCQLIVVSDAGGDPGFEFEDLGNAIRKIRIDPGIEIEMDAIAMHPRSSVDEHGVEPIRPGRCFTTGTIRYPESGSDRKVEGKLVYIKPGIYGGEPRDVTNYAATHPDFPHESTADQWFNESQYESYRRLGRHVAKQLFGNLKADATIDEIVAAAAPIQQPLEPAIPPGDSDKAERVATTDLPSHTSPPARRTGEVYPPIIHRRPPKGWFGRAR